MTLTAFTALIAAMAAMSVISDLATARVIHIRFDESSGGGFEENETEIDVDLGEEGVEFFPNGTEKREGLEHLIDMYQKVMKENMPDFEKSNDDKEDLQRVRRKIFGGDERLPINNPAPHPYCAVGYLDSGCTAVFIGPYHAITAASCVYDTTTNTWKRTQLNIRRGRTCGHSGTRMTWTNVYALQGYTVQHRREYDFALIVYNRNNPSPCYLSFGYMDTWSDVGFDTFGYPRDKPLQSGCRFYRSMWFTSCHYSDTLDSGLGLIYRCDVVQGNTGSALYGEWKGHSSGSKVVYGVNARYYTDWNYGVRLDRTRFCKIAEWMTSSGYTPKCGSSACCPT